MRSSDGYQWMDGWMKKIINSKNVSTTRYTHLQLFQCPPWKPDSLLASFLFYLRCHILSRSLSWHCPLLPSGRSRSLSFFLTRVTQYGFLYSWLSIFLTLLLSTRSAPTSSRDLYSLPTPTLWMSSALVSKKEMMGI